MPPPTTAVLFSASTPVASPGNQLAKPQSDGQQPAQTVSFEIPIATSALTGAVRADGTSITMDADGTIHSAGGATGGGRPTIVVPAGAIDGSNVIYTLPSASSANLYFKNGVLQNPADYIVSGNTLTRVTPLKPAGATQADWHLIALWA